MKGGEILSRHEYIMLDTKELTKDIGKIVEKHTKKALKMSGKGVSIKKPMYVGGDKGKPPSSVDKLKTEITGEGIQDKFLEYLTNPARISTDAGIAIAEEIGKSRGVPKEQRKESHRKTRQIVKDYVEPIGNLALLPEVAALKTLTAPEQKALMGQGLAGELALGAAQEVGAAKAKGKKSFFEKDKKEQLAAVKKSGRAAKRAATKVVDTAKDIGDKAKKMFGLGHERKGRMVKGSPEAIAWGQRMKEMREAKIDELNEIQFYSFNPRMLPEDVHSRPVMRALHRRPQHEVDQLRAMRDCEEKKTQKKVKQNKRKSRSLNPSRAKQERVGK